MTHNIILTRHGHVEGISPRRFRGREDVPLSKLGQTQAAATAKRIVEKWRPAAVYTSPMSRCVATAAAIGQACGVPMTVAESLNDLNYGYWQWKTHEEINRLYPEAYAKWHARPHLFRFPAGESLQELISRAGECLRFVLDRHNGETIVLVSHDSVNRAICMQLLEQPLSAYWRIVFDPSGLSEIEIDDDGTPLIKRINETAHLDHL